LIVQSVDILLKSFANLVDDCCFCYEKNRFFQFLQVIEVLIALGMCVSVFIALTFFSMQSKVDFTTMSGLLMSLLIVLLFFGIVGIFFRSMMMQFAYSAVGALLFSAYIIFDTQLIVGGKHKKTISPEEYIFVSLSLYLDVVVVSMFVINICK
jgi:FtsH-binding integral membrane protein